VDLPSCSSAAGLYLWGGSKKGRDYQDGDLGRGRQKTTRAKRGRERGGEKKPKRNSPSLVSSILQKIPRGKEKGLSGKRSERAGRGGGRDLVIRIKGEGETDVRNVVRH